jgi:hypothetical protein
MAINYGTAGTDNSIMFLILRPSLFLMGALGQSFVRKYWNIIPNRLQ